jgi:hypothetical protein
MLQAGTASRADTVENGKGSQSWAALRTHCDQRMVAMETYRWTWWTHWRELADYILPRRYRWLVTPNQWNRGSPINQRILINTATIALRNLASGMMSGITSPSRPWFRLDVADKGLAAQDDVKLWLDDCTGRMQRVMAASNYYTAKAMQYVDLACFGTAPMIIYEDIGTPSSNVIRCFNPCAGEYFCAVGPNFDVNTLYRKFAMSVDQVVAEFGIENVSENIRKAYAQGGARLEQEILIGHAIEPNAEFMQAAQGLTTRGIPAAFQYQEVFWEFGSTNTDVLRVKGFYDQPFSAPRWDTNGNDAYGRSPCMDCLGDVKQLQVQAKRKAQGLDKIVNPPMGADMALKNTPASLMAGDVTYLPSTNGVGFKPLFQISNMPIEEVSKDMDKAIERIKDTLYNDLFLMISGLDTVRTATEIDARKEEKLMMLGPVLERFDRESLAPDIVRIYRIMMRNGMFLPPPDALKNATVHPVYISSLADQQRATITTSIERVSAFIGNLQAVDAQAIDKLDVDVMIDEYADALRVPPQIIRSGKRLAAIRDARQQQAAQQQQLQASQAAVQGAQTLSQTDVGGGQNALAMMLQNAPSAGSA